MTEDLDAEGFQEAVFNSDDPRLQNYYSKANKFLETEETRKGVIEAWEQWYSEQTRE